jgi:hypothetical protein
MGFVDNHRLTVKAMAVELMAGLVGIFGGHFHKSETVADNRHRQDSADHLEKVFDGGSLSTVGKVTDQKFFGGYGCCHLEYLFSNVNIYARVVFSQALF